MGAETLVLVSAAVLAVIVAFALKARKTTHQSGALRGSKDPGSPRPTIVGPVSATARPEAALKTADIDLAALVALESAPELAELTFLEDTPKEALDRL